jgi:hypothetical protein
VKWWWGSISQDIRDILAMFVPLGVAALLAGAGLLLYEIAELIWGCS